MQDHESAFVPRPPISERISTPNTQPLSHIFDSNAVRAFGRLDEPTWQRFLAAWKTKGFTTGWIPWVVREVTGTNLLGVGGIIVLQDELEEIVRAVQRFDVLAEGDVLQGYDQLIKYSLFEYAGAPGGPSHLCEDEDVYRRRIHLCKRITNRAQIGKDWNSDGSFFLGLEDPEGGYYGQVVKREFVEHSKNAVAGWKKLITVDNKSTDEQIIHDIARQLQGLVIVHGDKLGVPHDVLQLVLDKWNAAKENPDTTFVYAEYVESWYYIEFARGNLTRKRRENDGHDIQIASYLSRARQFVTRDVDFRKILKRITRDADTRLVWPEDFITQVATAG